MSKTFPNMIMLILVTGILVGGLAYAQCPQMDPEQGMTKKSAMMPTLTADQQKNMMTLKMNYIKETSPIKTDLKIKGMELQMLWQADNVDAQKIVAKVKEINNLKASLEEKMVNNRLSMYKVLTPEQQKTIKGMMGMHGMGCCSMDDDYGMMGSGMNMGMGMMGGGMNMGMSSGQMGW